MEKLPQMSAGQTSELLTAMKKYRREKVQERDEIEGTIKHIDRDLPEVARALAVKLSIDITGSDLAQVDEVDATEKTPEKTRARASTAA